jgi:hypothetical protein
MECTWMDEKRGIGFDGERAGARFTTSKKDWFGPHQTPAYSRSLLVRPGDQPAARVKENGPL